jgi:mRNA-degrading endonuclease RelE of RelBE toxin-antitoxin system
MTGRSAGMKLGNPCAMKKDFCVNCHSHFMAIRPSLKTLVISKHFIRDLKDKEEMNSIVRGVLDCSSVDFNELHKFEEDIDGLLVFRAKKDGIHIVYCVDKKMRIIFLRAFKNYSEYKRFLEGRKEIEKMIARV